MNIHTFTNEINTLKNEIIQVANNKPVFIYIGVGTAAGMRNADNSLSAENYHQFPPFLQNLYNTVPNLHLFLLLIDPGQEKPLYMAEQYEMYYAQQYETHYAHTDDTHYKNNDGTLQAFVWRQDVYTDPDNNFPFNAVNITEMLRDLNQFAKSQNASLLYHDFTGRHVGLIAEYFDQDNAGFLDQIVYGFSARENHGCYFDLTQPNAQFAVKVQTHIRPIVKMFNYYKFISNSINASISNSISVNKIEQEINTYPVEMRYLIEEQKKSLLNSIVFSFKTLNMTMLRHVQTNIQRARMPDIDVVDDAVANNGYMNNYIYGHLPKMQQDIYKELSRENQYELLFELLFDYCARELDIYSQLKQLDLTGVEILEFITADQDPFKWYNNINMFL